MKVKKPQVSFSFPAKVLSFSTNNTNENEMFSRGRLAVFYKGETADRRFFSEDFSKELIKSLPYTPIVSYYNTETKDFVGHADQQAIYGIVDPCGEISFQTLEDGNEWAVCDTIYYTERKDVGEIAKQIEGHSQSLELADATYVINYDERRHLKNIEFTGGKFVGVSVLGKDQKPAFTGSAFFSVDDDKFCKDMKILKDFVEQKIKDQKEQVSNGGNMKIASYLEFTKMYWGDIANAVERALCKEYENEYYTYIVDMDNASAFVNFYSYIDGSLKTFRINYSINEQGEATLDTPVAVHKEWIDDQPTTEPVTDASVTEVTNVATESNLDNNNNSNGLNNSNTSESTETVTTVANEQQTTEAANATCADNSETQPEPTTVTENSVENNNLTPSTEESSQSTDNLSSAEVVDTNPQENASASQTKTDTNDETNTTQENTSSSASVEGQGEVFQTNTNQSNTVNTEELEKVREEKLHILAKYKDKVSEDKFNDYVLKLDKFATATDLENDILKAWVASIEQTAQENDSNTFIRRAFAYTPIINNNMQNTDKASDDWVKDALNR